LLALYYTGPTYQVTLAYLELKQLPGKGALKVLDIRIDDRAHAEICQGAKMNPTQRQTTYSLLAPSCRPRVRRPKQSPSRVGPLPSSLLCVCGLFELASSGAG